MHAVPTDKKNLKGEIIWTYRWREWLQITEEEYKKKFTDKKKAPPRKLIDGKLHYQSYETAKPGRDIPFYNEDQAKKNIFKFEAKFDARLRERKKRESWHDQYYHFTELIEIYVVRRKVSAKNSWDSKIFWFKDYVLHFFFNVKSSPNLEDWKHHFFDFKKFLENVISKRSGKPLAYASKNHCINELNYFLQLMWEEGKCEQQPKLPLFSERLVNNHKGAKDLIPDDEFEKVYQQIKNREEEETPGKSYFSDCYWLLRHTGLRINEMRGIGLYNVRPGLPPRQEIKDLLSDSNITHIYSYIFLIQQPAKTSRNDDGITIDFKPLKGKLGVPQDARYIPITDPMAHDIIRKYRRIQLDLKENNQFGKEDTNYSFFFDHVSAQQMRQWIFKAYCDLGIREKYKSTHHARHSKTTEIVRTSRGMNDELAKAIIGHARGSKTTQRYNLLYQEIVEEEMRNDHVGRAFDEASMIDEKYRIAKETSLPFGVPNFAKKRKA